VLCSDAVAAAVGHAGGLTDLGTPEPDLPRLWGWTPPLTAPSGVRK
jgi:hypothetical protein